MSFIAGLTAVLGTVLAQGDQGRVTRADYAAATAVLARNLQELVRNESVQPYWIGDSGRFWYQRDRDEGPEFVLVTVPGAKGNRRGTIR